MSDVEEQVAMNAWVGRAVGVLQVLGGALEAAGGVGLVLVPEPTFLTKAGGTILIAHSADTIVAGLQSIWTGAIQQSYTHEGAAALARTAKVPERYVGAVATGVDIAAGVGPSAAAQVARYAAINAAQRATDRVAIAWLSQGVSRVDHTAVGVARGRWMQWFDLAVDGNRALKEEGAVSFAVREMPHDGYVITQIAVPAERSASALKASYELAAEGSKTWGLLGPNCATTTMKILREGGIAIPAWARAPAALHFGVRHGYAVTAVGSTVSAAVPGSLAPVAPPRPVAPPALVSPPGPWR